MTRRRFSELDDTNEHGSAFSLIADFDGNEEQLFDWQVSADSPLAQHGVISRSRASSSRRT